jgi:hypothetical protein
MGTLASAVSRYELMNHQVDPKWKESILTILILGPFVCLLGTEHIDKGEVWVVFGIDLFVYTLARIAARRKTGSWKW